MTATVTTTQRHGWLPSLSAGIWLFLLLGLTLSPMRMKFISADGDPCLHWRIGQWMIEHHAVIRTDQFSHTRFGAPLISKEWLSEVLWAAAGLALGWNGIVLVSALLIATTFWLLHRQLLAEGNELLLSTGLVMLAALTASTHWIARPHLFTHLLTVVYAWQLRRFDRGQLSARRLLAVLAPSMVLWVNLHGAFFTGLMLIGIYFVGASGSLAGASSDRRAAIRRKIGQLALVGLACGAVSLLNPNGWRLHAQIIGFLRTPALTGLVDEFSPANFHTPGLEGFLIQLLLLGLLFLWGRVRLPAMDLLLIGVWGFFTLYSTRNVAIFAIVATPILAEHLQSVSRAARNSCLMRWYHRVSADVTELDRHARGRGLVAVAVVLLVAAMAKPRVAGGEPLIATDILTNRFPAAAVRFLHDHPGCVSGNMFNGYTWGGYLMLEMPEHKVFIDGRNDFYGADLVKEFQKVDNVQPGWEGVLDKYAVSWIILPTGHPLASLLVMRNDWHLLHDQPDPVATIYVRWPANAAATVP